MCFSLRDSGGGTCYNYVNTWGDIVFGDYYIPNTSNNSCITK
jgi:hypothetical protein